MPARRHLRPRRLITLKNDRTQAPMARRNGRWSQRRESVQGKVWREGEGKQHAAPPLEHRVARPGTPTGLGCRLKGLEETLTTAHCIDYAGKEEAAL
jgi:hypothetical protein